MSGVVSIGMDQLNGIISQAALLKAVQRGKIVRLRRSGLNTSALYDVDSFPLKYRIEIYKRYPYLKDDSIARPFIERIEVDGFAARFFEKYQTSDGRYLPVAKQIEYINKACILNMFKTFLATNIKRGEFWQQVSKALPGITREYPCKLPSNILRLQELFSRYCKDGYAVLVSSKYGNSNAAK